MWGAIIGDIAGSTYEYDQIKKIESVKVTDIIKDNSFFSDDTILTIAVLDAILHDRDYGKYLKKYGKEYSNYIPNIKPYFERPFSPGFMKWINGEEEGKSAGNGAMMRISPVGYMFDTEDDVRKNSKLATIPSHNSEEAIKNSEIIALIIYYSRNGLTKEDIINKLNIKLKYRAFNKFNVTCNETIDNCLYALFTSNSFEESIKKVISYGGDTDTNACIVGSMAETIYGINTYLIEKAKQKLPIKFVKIIEEAYKIKQKLVDDYER